MVEEAEAEAEAKAEETNRNNGNGGGKYEMKFHPAFDSHSRQPVSYTTVKEHIINYVQREYDRGADVARSLEDLQVFDLDAVKPVRQQSKKIDPTTNQLFSDG